MKKETCGKHVKGKERCMNIPGNLVAGGLLVINSVRDIRKREILLLPTLLVLTGGILRGIAASAGEAGLWFPALLPGAVLLLLSLATSGRVGFGDGLAVCAAGIWCGPEQILIAVFFALLLVSGAAGILRLCRRRVSELPFLPFLLAGFLLTQIMVQTGGT